MTQIIPIRQGVALRELMCGKHEKPVTRDDLIRDAVKAVAERQSIHGVISPIRLMRFWLEDGTAPFNSIRSAYRSLS